MLKAYMQKAAEKANFLADWSETMQAWAPAVRVTSAVFKLTNAGEKPADLEKLAAMAGFPPDQTATMVLQFFTNTARIQNGLVHLEMATTRQPSSRFQLRIGDCRLYTEGCAPDQFWIAYFIDKPVEIRATCQATALPITVVVSAAGVEAVEPAGAAIGLINPATVQKVKRADEFDEKVCVYQTFFASMDAGAAWKLQHPQGRLFPVREFFDFWYQLLTPIAGELMTTVRQSKEG